MCVCVCDFVRRWPVFSHRIYESSWIIDISAIPLSAALMHTSARSTIDDRANKKWFHEYKRMNRLSDVSDDSIALLFILDFSHTLPTPTRSSATLNIVFIYLKVFFSVTCSFFLQENFPWLPIDQSNRTTGRSVKRKLTTIESKYISSNFV